MHCKLDVCIQFGWIAIITKCWENPEKKSMDCVDTVYGFSGHCPWSQWALSMDSVDIVHGLSGHCPCSNTPAGQCPWTMSTESMDFLQMGRHYRVKLLQRRKCLYTKFTLIREQRQLREYRLTEFQSTSCLLALLSQTTWPLHLQRIVVIKQLGTL